MHLPGVLSVCLYLICFVFGLHLSDCFLFVLHMSDDVLPVYLHLSDVFLFVLHLSDVLPVCPVFVYCILYLS